jgi:hypothetical protein
MFYSDFDDPSIAPRQVSARERELAEFLLSENFPGRNEVRSRLDLVVRCPTLDLPI